MPVSMTPTTFAREPTVMFQAEGASMSEPEYRRRRSGSTPYPPAPERRERRVVRENRRAEQIVRLDVLDVGFLLQLLNQRGGPEAAQSQPADIGDDERLGLVDVGPGFDVSLPRLGARADPHEHFAVRGLAAVDDRRTS